MSAASPRGARTAGRVEGLVIAAEGEVGMGEFMARDAAKSVDVVEACLINQSANDLRTDRFVFRALGVPLHAEVEAAVGMLDGFDHAILAGRGDAERARVADGLAVVTSDLYPSTTPDDRGENAFARERNAVGRVVVVVVGGLEGFGEVLVHRAAGDEGHHLHTQTDAQSRNVGTVHESIQQFSIETLAEFMDRHCLRVGWSAEGLGAWVVAADEDEAVAALQVRGDQLDYRGKDDRPAARVGNGTRVGERAHRTHAAGARLNDIGGDADGRASGAVWVPGCSESTHG